MPGNQRRVSGNQRRGFWKPAMPVEVRTLPISLLPRRPRSETSTKVKVDITYLGVWRDWWGEGTDDPTEFVRKAEFRTGMVPMRAAGSIRVFFTSECVMSTKKLEKKASSAAEGSPVLSPALITSTANASNHSTKVDLQVAWSGLIAGLLGHYPEGYTFDLPQGQIGRDDVVTKLRRFIVIAEVTKARKKEYRSAVQDERRALAELRPLYESVVGAVKVRHGKASPDLLGFGIPPAKPRKKSAEVKAEAVRKARATRQTMRTRGKKEREARRGEPPAPAATAPREPSGSHG